VPKIHVGEKTAPATSGVGKSSTGIRLKVDPHFSSCTKIKLKWIKDLSIRP
jgi:hypothetical protein